MEPIPRTHIWQYTDVDRTFWAEHLEEWVPKRVFDAHVHVLDPGLMLQPLTEARRKQLWVTEVAEPMPAEDLAHCDKIVYPGRDVSHVAFGWPDLTYDLEGGNEYARTECIRHGWRSLALLRPQWSAERVAAELDKPGVIGVKPYYALIGADPTSRDRYIESSIFDFLPHHALEVLNDRRAWLTLHVPKIDRLGHPDNIREIREIRRRYPDVIVVLPHLGRCYAEPHAAEGLPHLADDEGLYWDNSAVLNPAVHRMALELLGPDRILYGTDNPVFYMRGRRQWQGRRYLNYTSADLFFNKDQHEPPDVEAGYTLFMYEALKAFKDSCEAIGIGRAGVEAMFSGNAERLAEIAGSTR
ncbi:MAG: amidohydrolase family protein [Planctomycetota bacterium]